MGGRLASEYAHVDPDVFDPDLQRGDGLAVQGGLDPGEIVASERAALREAPLAGLSIGSYDPRKDDPTAGPRILGEVMRTLSAATASPAAGTRGYL